MTPRSCVITSSDSVAAGRNTDESGAIAVAALRDLGFDVDGPVVVPDEPERIAAAVGAAITGGAALVVTNGGTGLGPRDVTVSTVESLGGVLLPGIGEAMRAEARSRIPTTDLSRAGAYRVDAALVLCLPGSPGGVRDGMRVAGPLLLHAVAMLGGGGHQPAPPPESTPRAVVTASPIDLEALRAAVTDDTTGAVVVFEGRVRNHDQGRSVTALAYEGHPDADAVLDSVVRACAQRPGVRAAAAAHRVGEVAIGELAFAAVVSASHRAAAFEACSWLVDEVKRELPVWKRQTFDDGSHEWVNCA